MCAFEASVQPQPLAPRIGFSVAELALCFGLLLVPWLGLWWLLRDLQGWPSNDDPFYAKPLYFWVHEGRIQQVSQYGYLTASSVAHILTGALASVGGFSFRNLYLACIVQQALAALALYACGRQLRLSHTAAGLLAASLVSYPLYFGHAFTFMTDGPAAAWSCLACVWMSWGWLQNKPGWLMAGALAIGWGYWIRQTNGALLIAPAILAFTHARTRRLLVWPTVLALGMILALESSLLVPSSSTRLADIAPQPVDEYWKRRLIAAYGWLLLVGWYTLPLAPWLIQAAWRHRSGCHPAARWTACGCGTLTLIAGMLPLVGTQGRAYLTNATGCFIQNGHLGPIFLSDMDDPGRWGTLGEVQWPGWLWQVLTVASILSASAIGWWAGWTLFQVIQPIIQRIWASAAPRSERPLVISAFAWLSVIAASVLAICLFVEPHMDRYWLFLMPVVSLFLMLLAAEQGWQLSRLALAWGVGCMALQLWMSTVLVHDMLAWNNARWQFVQTHLSAGQSADSLDAGRDVNAWLRMDEDPHTSARPGDESRWWSGRATLCISTGPREGWQVHSQLPWNAWATGQTHYLFVLRRSPTDG